jgi:hypothetical protein
MRVLVRPFLLFALLCGFTYTQSHADDAAAPPINTLVWTNGFPKALVGGVDVSVDLGPAPGWTCTNVSILVVDATTNTTLGDYDLDNPSGLVVAHTFPGIGNKVKVRVTVDAMFENAGMSDPKQIQTYLTTK